MAELEEAKKELEQQVLMEFKRKSMGSEEGNPDLMERLQNKINENFKELKEKNKRVWSLKYREKTEQFSEMMRDKIFR